MDAASVLSELSDTATPGLFRLHHIGSSDTLNLAAIFGNKPKYEQNKKIQTDLIDAASSSKFISQSSYIATK